MRYEVFYVLVVLLIFFGLIWHYETALANAHLQVDALKDRLNEAHAEMKKLRPKQHHSNVVELRPAVPGTLEFDELFSGFKDM